MKHSIKKQKHSKKHPFKNRLKSKKNTKKYVKFNNTRKPKTTKKLKTTRKPKTTKKLKTTRKPKTTRKLKRKNNQGGNQNNNTKKLINSTKNDKRNIKHEKQKAQADYEEDKVRVIEKKIEAKKKAKILKELQEKDREERKLKKQNKKNQKIIDAELNRSNSEDKQKLLDDVLTKSLSKRKNIKLYIKNHIGPEHIGHQIHHLIGEFLIKPRRIRNEIRNSPYVRGMSGIAMITSIYQKYANEKLFCVKLEETPSRKKLFSKNSLKNLKTIYMGNTVSEVKESVSTPGNGIYIFIVMKKNKKRIFIGTMLKEATDVSEKYTKALIRESLSQKNPLLLPPVPYPQQPIMYPQQQIMYPQQQIMYPQQQSVALNEKKWLNTGIDV